MSLNVARGTGNILADQRKIEMGDTIALLEPDASPLTLLSRKAGKKPTGDPKFQWLEDAADARFDATTSTQLVGDTAINVGSGGNFGADYIVLVTRTGELFRVVSVAANVLTVVRGVGTTAAAALLNADELYIVGVAAQEGAGAAVPISNNPTKQFNYTQIFKKSWEVTGTAGSSQNQVNPHDWNQQANKEGIEHAKDIELAILLGQRAEDLTGTQPRRMTKGAIPFITTNVVDAGGTLTDATFQKTYLRKLFRYGPKRKQALASGLVVAALNGLANGKLQMRQGDSTYGLAVFDFISPFGTLEVMTHWLLDGTIYGGYCVGLDFSEVNYRYVAGGPLGSRDTSIVTHVESRGTDGRRDQYLTECGLELGLEQRHAILKNVTG